MYIYVYMCMYVYMYTCIHTRTPCHIFMSYQAGFGCLAVYTTHNIAVWLIMIQNSIPLLALRSLCVVATDGRFTIRKSRFLTVSFTASDPSRCVLFV